MRKWLTLSIIVLCSYFAEAQINSWTGAIDNNWSNTGNWSLGVVPTVAHDVRINGAGDNPVLDVPGNALLVSVINGASLDLNGMSLNVSDRLNVNGSTILGNGDLTFGRITASDATFAGNVDFVKTGMIANNSTFGGATTFNGTVTFDNQGTAANIVISNVDLSVVEFNGPATFTRTNSNIIIASRGLVTFNDDVTFNIASTGSTYNIAATGLGAVAFNADVYLNSSVGGTFNIGDITGPDNTLAGAFKTTGFTGGATLTFEKVIQTGNVAHDAFGINVCNFTDCAFGGGWTLTANTLNFASSSFNGINTFQTRQGGVSSCSFNMNGGTTSFTKVLGVTLSWNGGNSFYGPFTFTRTGSGTVNLASAAGNVFYDNANFINNSSPGSLNPLSSPGITSHFHDTISTVGTMFPVVFGPGIMEINGPGNRHFDGSGTHTVNQLVLNTDPGGSLTLNVPLNISSQVTFMRGILYSSNSSLPVFAAGASATGASDSSYVDGPARKIDMPVASTFIFPVGDAGNYGPIGVEIASGAPTFTAQYHYSSPAGGGYSPNSVDVMVDHVSQSEYWDLNGANLGSAHVLLYWGPRSQGVTDPSGLLVSHWDGAMWSSPSSVTFVDNMDGTGYLRTDNALTSFSPFTLGSSLPLPANPLPVNLISFIAWPEQDVVLINWATANEHNNALFTVERSADGRTFTPVASIPGAGDSFNTLYYATSDRSPLPGISYYRLQQTDFDGTSTYSNLVSVDRSLQGGISIFPNPVSDLLTIETGNQQTEVRMASFNGSLVAPAVQNEAGRWTLNVSTLAPGWYTLIITTAQDVHTEKVLIKR